MADRPRYSRYQLEQFFNRIALPEPKRLYSVTSQIDFEEKLGYLDLLLKHTLVRIPFENLTQHYSWHRTVNVHPQHLFNKIVRQSSRRGGYCMENNSLFHTVLLSLGFDVFMAGARVYNKETDRYGGFTHCVNIVIIGPVYYMVDIGFGANGPTRPMPMVLFGDGDVVYRHLDGIPEACAHMRLVKEAIPQLVDQSQKVWVYQHCIDRESEWSPMYCFVDTEFLLEDIRGMNLSPWKSPSSWFTQKLVLSRFTTDLETDEGDGPGSASEDSLDGYIDGALILFEDTLKWRRNERTVFEIKLQNEAQRIEAIRKYFGIELDEEDREAIRGTVSEIKHQAPIM
ncbi:arylamine N-acetyltransferase 3 [Hypoxylon rubiginosum]|uniref:Arylamine N-acetyltransferase 3 n=1 Tax=Hypoxylon rubiginosum TaxID=110542 RepID=A0ACC0CJX7_9PEZI|nr:arylamine N-acetyltransferase 3 [Hypoxylon rubiginosum]